MDKTLLEPPFNADALLRSKASIKRQLLAQPINWLEKKIAVLGGSTSAEVVDQLELALLARGIKPQFYQSEYNRYYEEALFPPQALLQFAPDLIYLHTTSLNIMEFPRIAHSIEDVNELLQSQFDCFQSIWKSVETIFACPVIQNNFDQFWNRPLGNLDGSEYRGRSRFINRLNEQLAVAAETNKNIVIHDIHYLSAKVGIDQWFNPRLWYLYKYAIDLEVIPRFAYNLSSVMAALWGRSNKALVLDLDNTLWGGVIGDEGVEGIRIGTGGAEAEAHAGLQQYAKALKDRGILLAVASKNDEANARASFSHDETVLKEEDFSAFKANWDPKPNNLSAIADELNIGINALVFVDDNPAERDWVKAQLPDVLVPEMGVDITDFVRRLDESSLFEAVSISAEDVSRTDQYQQNVVRKQQAALYKSYEDYLASLQMHAEISPFNATYFPRIVQLINKTNQFNLTTQRVSEAEVKEMISNPARIHLYGRLQDKFGDNGLVSVISGEIKNKVLHIDFWLMSCRVFKRGLEYAMFEQLCLLAKKMGALDVAGYYKPTQKNSMVKDLYFSLGFIEQSCSADEVVWNMKLTPDNLKNKHVIEVAVGNRDE